MKRKLTEPGANKLPYKAIKELKGGERPPQWDVHNINPQLNDRETADCLASFFNSISNEFPPLTGEDIPKSWDKSYPFIFNHMK